MYQDYFGFKEPPFTLTPNPEFLFLSRCHQEAYAHLLYAIEGRAGFIELSGEVGTGKTTIIRTLLGQLSPEKYRSALIFNPTLSPLGLMQEINREFGLFFASNEPRELHQVLNDFLLQENGADRTVVLVIDEAQNLSREVLEQVRLISNLETAKEKLIQIVLVGQPELRGILAREDLRQLNQRISVRYYLDRMDAGDIHAYIRHRIRIAAEGREPVVFSAEAIRRIARYAKGLPRQINSACDRALLLAYTKDAKEISAKMAVTAIADLTKTKKPSFATRILMALLLLTFTMVAAYLVFSSRTSTDKAQQPLPEVVEKSLIPVSGVAILQELLIKTGHYDGQVTDRFDSVTEAAVRSFQLSAGLAVDGRPGGQTLMRLYQQTGGKFTIYSTGSERAEAIK